MNKYGFKTYQLCDSSNGYCSRIKLYIGICQEAPSGNGITYDLVFRLMDPYLNKGHILYTDNYYLSPALFLDLSRAGTGASGTTRFRKGFPKRLKEQEITRHGSYSVMHDGALVAVKLRDQKTFLSTVHSMDMVDAGKKCNDGERIRKYSIDTLDILI